MTMTAIELMAEIDKQRSRDMSQADFAKFLGIHKSHYSRLLSGEREPTISFIKKVNARLPHLWPEIQKYLTGLAENLADKQANMPLRDARKAIDEGGAV